MGVIAFSRETVFIFESSEWLFRGVEWFSGVWASRGKGRLGAHLTVAGEVHTGVCRQPGVLKLWVVQSAFPREAAHVFTTSEKLPHL